MGGTCKGICPRFGFDKSKYPKIEEYHGYKVFRGGHVAIYGNGGKRCSICEIYLDYDGAFCPCCGMHLRFTARLSAYRNNKHKPRY